jgi:hypothetical protein
MLRQTPLLPLVQDIVDPDIVGETPEQCRFIGAKVTKQLDYEPARLFDAAVMRRESFLY